MPETALPLPGPEKVDCPDGCGKFGRPVKKRHGHVRGCPCRSCLNGRNSQGGKRRHRQFAKKAGITTGPWSTSQEESWRDRELWEVKSGAQVQPIITRYLLARAQAEAQRSIGDTRAFAFGVEPTRAADPSLVVVETGYWRELHDQLRDLEALLDRPTVDDASTRFVERTP